MRILVILAFVGTALAQDPLPDTAALAPATGDERSKAMVAGIDRFALLKIKEAGKERKALWQRDLTTPEAYVKSVAGNREHLRKILGLREEDIRLPITGLQFLTTTERDSKLAEAEGYTVHMVRWPVLEGVHGEGLYIKQREAPKARVILLPDADQTPEQLAGLIKGDEALGQCAHELALAGCEVIIPTLASRATDYSGSESAAMRTNQPHREWLYRQSYEMGRHVIGYELHKVFALVDWMSSKADVPVAVAGYGEGGQLALYAGALDTRIDATLVCGAFENRDKLWSQPIYRNVSGFLKEFGDAELATLVLPRNLIISHGRYPVVTGPPAPAPGLIVSAASGRLGAPELKEVRAEVDRARQLTKGAYDKNLRLVLQEDEENDTGPFPVLATEWLRKDLQLTSMRAPSVLRLTRGPLPDDADRQRRTVREMENYTQRLLASCEAERTARFWKKLPPTSPDKHAEATKPFREELWQVIGRLPDPSLPASPRSRYLYETDAFTAYEVMLDVWQDVPAWGYLLLPKNIKEGEKRPVVVCQHGLEGLPEDVVNEDESSKAWKPYKGFAANLARQGYITFAPHNFYRGQDQFRVVQRKLNTVGLTLFSVIIGQHQRILEWLKAQPQVDAQRIAFYGLSYGGKSAMRIPAVLEDYCLSICSGDFNEWIRKNVSTAGRPSYMFTHEYEIFEWNLGPTYNYAEMAGLIAPRPFMVERGHDDGVAVDEWVGWEFAKIRRLYNKLGIGERTEIEWFNGPHTINGVGTYEFLHKQLGFNLAK